MKKICMVFMLGCATALSVEAAGGLGLPEKTSAFTYNYADFSYVSLRNVGAGRSAGNVDGVKVNASSDIDTNVGLIGSLLFTSGNKVDMNMLTFGGAYHQEVKDVDVRKMDVIFHGELEYADIGYSRGKDVSDLGVRLGAGVRALIVPTVELSSDLSISSNDFNKTALTIGSSYIFSPEMQAIAAIQLGDMDVLSVGVRYNF